MVAVALLGLLCGVPYVQQAPVPADLILESGVRYAQADARQQVMDIVRPRAAGPHPAVMCIHGGRFSKGSRAIYVEQCIRLAQRGYVAATVDYRLAPAAVFPAAVHDVKAAVRYLGASAGRLGIDAERIGALGESAGGHLALFLGTTAHVPEFEGDGPNREQSSRVSCVVDYFGLSDFTNWHSEVASEVSARFLGGDLSHQPLTYIRASPVSWVTPDAAPTLAVHGANDPLITFEQSVRIVDRLLAAGVEAELEIIAGAGHGFTGADERRAEQRMLAFFDRYLKPK